MEKEIKKTIQYFGFFHYAPLKDEIYLFLKKKANFSAFETKSVTFLKDKEIKTLRMAPPRYTLGEYSIPGKYMEQKVRSSARKIQKTRLYMRLVGFFPQIRLIGLSGSVAMQNADKEADIDIFVISASDRLWTARFIAIGVAKILGIHRSYDESHVGDKVCLNLFFDEQNLQIPRHKRTEYGAHEVLQMKPVMSKGNCYLIYLDSNRWVFDIFPNAKKLMEPKSRKKRVKNFQVPILGDFLEYILKKWQLISINKRITTELITPTQLWFFPDDFELRIPGRKKGASRG